ncbi:MAG: RdgB/HAM1 family non-canonical purine NTP pyrophosphatase [Chloroflexi bacterium]|nr:RdgB/HAM1 family non-canonical purine NTP pyrophosphatase [Chloroflexota bacterium]
MQPLLVATQNPGKLAELQELLLDMPWDLIMTRKIELDLRVAETAFTFRDNAILKATAYASASGLITLADDSGLEVAVLGGLPGIYTARFGGMGLDDVARYQLLLDRMQAVPWQYRQAQFSCAVAIATPQGQVFTTEGIIEGYIAWGPAGQNGFGYDPIFQLPPYQCSMAELPETLKNQMSHRAQAVRAARDVLLRLAETTIPE